MNFPSFEEIFQLSRWQRHRKMKNGETADPFQRVLVEKVQELARSMGSLLQTGGGDGTVGEYWEYTFSEVASADYAFVDDPFFTPENSGYYRIAVFAENIDDASTGGSFDWEVTQGGNVLGSNGFGIFPAGVPLAGSGFEIIVEAGVPVIFRRSINGFIAPNTEYRVRATATLLA